MRKLGFKLSIIEAELNLLDAYKKKSVFQPKICTPLLYIMKFSKRNQFTLNYSVEYFTRIIFCESFQGISHMPYAGGFSHFGQKKQFKIKIKLKQRKITWHLPQISRGQQFFAVSIKTQLYGCFYGKDKNPAILLTLLVLALLWRKRSTMGGVVIQDSRKTYPRFQSIGIIVWPTYLFGKKWY